MGVVIYQLLFIASKFKLHFIIVYNVNEFILIYCNLTYMCMWSRVTICNGVFYYH